MVMHGRIAGVLKGESLWEDDGVDKVLANCPALLDNMPKRTSNDSETAASEFFTHQPRIGKRHNQ